MATSMQDRVGSPATPPVGGARGGPLLVVVTTHVFVIGLSLWVAYIGTRAAEVNGQPAAEPALVAAGVLGALVGLALAPASILLALLLSHRRANPMAVRLDELIHYARIFAEHGALSDDARRALNRRVERDVLRRAIEEDIASEDWDAALVLCTELADRFGYRTDAEEFRARIDAARFNTLDRAVSEGVATVDGLTLQRRWGEAAQEASRLSRLYPDNRYASELPQRVERARSAYKADVERRFLQAAGADDVETAMELLRELDAYLTEAEAQPYREVARGVIDKARDQLGARFKMAVQDRQWVAAVELGRRIIREFPNTRMAGEVRGLLDGLLARANAADSNGGV